MARVITDEQNYYDIADAIRGKLEVETLYLPSEMAAAIETIETGIELTSEDEGKVVIEDEGAYILAEQTSQTITFNGTYDTTTVNELIANISGGGMAKNILSGNNVPASAIGSNGDIYLQLSGELTPFQTYNISDIHSSVINNTLTIIGTTAGSDTSDGKFSGIILETDINAVNISVTPHQNGMQYGTSYEGGRLPTIISTGSGRDGYSSSADGYNFSKSSNERYFAAAYDNGIGNQVTIEITPTDPTKHFVVEGTSIFNVYLKVNGSWVLIEGQDISDVNTGVELIEKTIISNGTYDPTDDSAEGYSLVTVNVPQSGGGGSTNVLSGTTAPTAQDGDDGDIYLFFAKTFNIQPLVSSASELAVTVTANSTWSGFDPWRAFASSGNPWIGDGGDPHWLQIEIPNEVSLYDVTFGVTDSNRAHAISRIGYSSNGSNYTDMALESSTFTNGNGYAKVASPIAARYFRLFFDGSYGVSDYPSIARLQMRGVAASGGTIQSVYLKVNGSWVPIVGQDIDDVDTGGSGGGSLVITGYYSGMSASSLYGSQIPERAVGAQPNSWCGFNSKAQNWWMIELNEPMKVSTVRFANYYTAGGGGTWYSDSVTFQGGDGTTWTDLLTVSGLEQSNEQREYPIQDPDEYTHYRFVCNNTTATTYYTGIGKIQLFT